jgi:hypothetical protein
VLSLSATEVRAVTQTWDGGAGDNNLNSANNWNTNGVPANFTIVQWNGTVAGNLGLFFNSAFGSGGGYGIDMTGAQTGNLTITNSTGASQTFRLSNAGSSGGSFTMQSGAGAFTLGGTGGAIGLTITTGSAAKNVTLTNNSASLATFNFDVLGNITGSGAAGFSIAKTGTGTLTLAGNNTGLNGAITVSGGKLLVNNTTGSGTGTNAVTVGTNATLGGSGTITGNTTVDGKLNSSGKLTFGAALTLTGTSETTFEIGSLTNYDVLANDGGDTVTFNNGATIVFDASGYTANRGDSFLVLSNWSSRVASGTINFTVTNLTSGYSLDTSKLISDGYVTVNGVSTSGLYVALQRKEIKTYVQDQGWRFIVTPESVISVRTNGEQSAGPMIVDDEHAVLIRYDLTQVPLETTLNSYISYKGTGVGAGDAPSFAVWAVEIVGETGEIIKKERVQEVTVRPEVNGAILLPVERCLRQRLQDGHVSFLIEMRTTPGFSRAVEFSGTPWLSINKAQIPMYRLDELLTPIWTGDLMVNETVLPTSYEGNSAEANLAFVPSRIISVKNYTLDKTYQEGTDFAIEGRTIRLLPGSSIPFFRYDELYHNDPNAKPNVMPTLDGGYLTFSEGAFFEAKQLAVTYEHLEPWAGPVPQSVESLLPKTFEKLKTGQPLRLVVFGDSISFGNNASRVMNRAPFMPRWGDLLAGELARVYGSEIDFINPSRGGSTSAWGNSTINALVSLENPDLVILGFGMNESNPTVLSDNIEAMMAAVRSQNPDAEFILLMSFQPNGKWRSLDVMASQLTALKGLEGPGVAVADVWSVHGYLLAHKTYWDMTGNHVNHPNDFLVRVYAQTLLALLGVD